MLTFRDTGTGVGSHRMSCKKPGGGESAKHHERLESETDYGVFLVLVLVCVFILFLFFDSFRS